MKIEIYSKTSCPFCQLAKRYLDGHAIDYQEIIYDDDAERQAMYDRFGLEGTQRTVPQIIIIDANISDRIGGYTDLIESDVVARHHVGEFNLEF